MANRNFGRNLLLALGSLGALSGAINPNIKAMEGVKNVNEHDEKHEKFNKILDEALEKMYVKPWLDRGTFDRNFEDYQIGDIKKTTDALTEPRIAQERDLTNVQKSKLELLVLKYTRLLLKKTNYGLGDEYGGSTTTVHRSGPPTLFDDEISSLKCMMCWVFEREEKLIWDLQDMLSACKRHMLESERSYYMHTRDISKELNKLDELIKTYEK